MFDQDEPHKRYLKNLLLAPRLQLFIIGYFSIISLVAIAYVIIVFNERNQKILGLFSKLNLPVNHPIGRGLELQTSFLSPEFIGFAVGFFLLFFVGGLILSHRIAGPVYRLRQHLKSCHGKRPTQIQFRDGDFFHELANDFNSYVESIEECEKL